MSFTVKNHILTGIIIAAAAFTASADETVPCTMNINSAAAFDEWKTVDVDKDGGLHQFRYALAQKAAVCNGSNIWGADDWLISPAVHFDAGHTYEVVVTYLTELDEKDELNLNIMFGREQATTGMQLISANKKLADSADQKCTLSSQFRTTDAGSYHIGLHLEGKSGNYSFSVYSVELKAVAARPSAVSDLAITAASLGVLEAELTWNWPTTDSNGRELTESLLGARIYRSTQADFSPDESTLVHTIEGSFTPGSSAAWTDNTITEAGYYFYRVVPFDATGECTYTGVEGTCSPWIGEDTELAPVTNVRAVSSGEDGTTVTITWDATTGALHGGYIDPTKPITYRIRCSKGYNTDDFFVSTVAASYDGLSYVHTNTMGHDAYTYFVSPVYNGKAAKESTASDWVIAGGDAKIPYIETFVCPSDEPMPFLDFVTFHSDDTADDWKFGDVGVEHAYGCDGSEADAYAVSPRFYMKPGIPYSVSLSRMTVRDSAEPITFEVLAGKEPTVESLTKKVYTETITSKVSGSIDGRRNAVFTVDAEGYYHVALHVKRAANSEPLYIYNWFGIEEIEIVPDNITEAAILVDPNGLHDVTLSWTNPQKTNLGTEATPCCITIVRTDADKNSTTVYINDQCVAGEHVSFVDHPEKAGFYTYTITPSINGHANDSAELSTTWVGCDTPETPYYATSLLLDNGDRLIYADFDITGSVHGGYMAKPTYNVYRNGVLIGNFPSVTKDAQVIDSEKDLPYDAYYYRIAAVSGNLVSGQSMTSVLHFGTPLELPYSPALSKEKEFDKWSSTHGWSYIESQNRPGVILRHAYTYTPPILCESTSLNLHFTLERGQYESDDYIWVYYLPDNSENAQNLPSINIDDLAPELQHIKSVYLPHTDTSKTTDFTFNVPQKGSYRIAFFAASQPIGAIYLKELRLNATRGIVGIEEVDSGVNPEAMTYDRAGTMLQAAAEGRFEVINAEGATVLAGEGSELCVASLPRGLYIARFTAAGAGTPAATTLKFVR